MLSAWKRFSQYDTNLGKIYFENILLIRDCTQEPLLYIPAIHSCLSRVLFGRSSGVLREIWLITSVAPEEIPKKCQSNIVEMPNQKRPNIKRIRSTSIKIFFPGWYRTGKSPF